MGKKRHRASPQPAHVAADARPRRLAVSHETVAQSRIRPPAADPFVSATHPRSSTPDATMAMDDGISTSISWAQASYSSGIFGEGLAFLGYPMLAEMAQRPEYRRFAEVIARHMTRKWIRLQATGDEDKSERIKVIETAMERLGVRDIFREVAEHDSFFGRGHVYLDFGTSGDPVELKTSIGDGYNSASRSKVGKGSLKGLKTIEPVWCYPQGYNSSDPLSPDWYKPSSWFTMSREVHGSRLLTFVGREVPDLLKPAYSFGGLSLSQMAKPYVDNWLRTRQSVADIVSAFSVFVLKTRMAESLSLDGLGREGEIFRRADLFNNLRDNRGLMMIDETEEFQNVSASLASLDALQAQAQEHMASVSAIPLVELTGISPSGLNASSEGEILTFEKTIHSNQERFFRPNLTRILGFIQLSEFGDVDPEITFEFEPLGAPSEKEMAETRKIEADTDAVLIDSGVISPAEARKRVSEDGSTPYHGLNPDELPEPPVPGEMGGAFGEDPPAPEEPIASPEADRQA